MSSAEDQLKKLGFRLVEIESAKDLVQSKLNAKLDNLCSGEVGEEWAKSLFASESKKALKAFKVVKIGEAKTTVGILMYVNPMRAYSNDKFADLFAENSKKIGFDQSTQYGEAAELLVFCVEEKSRSKGLGKLLLLHAIEDSNKKFFVVGQEEGPNHAKASKFYGELFDEKITGNDGKTYNFYFGLSKKIAARLRGEAPRIGVAAPANKPAASKKPSKPAAVSGKRRRTAKVCGKTVKRSESFLNSVGKLFKLMRDQLKVESTLSMRAACTIDAILRDSLERIGTNINSLLASRHSKTVDVNTVTKAISLEFGDPKVSELSKLMIVNGGKAVTKFKDSNKSGKKTSRAARADLIIAPARVVRLLRESRVAQRFGKFADIHLAAALEALATELLDGSLRMIKESTAKKGRVSPRVVMLFVQGDPELRKVIRGTFGSAGVTPMQQYAKKAKKQ